MRIMSFYEDDPKGDGGHPDMSVNVHTPNVTPTFNPGHSGEVMAEGHDAQGNEIQLVEGADGSGLTQIVVDK